MDFSQFIKSSPEERANIYNTIVTQPITSEGGTLSTGNQGDLTPLTPEQQAAKIKELGIGQQKEVNSFANHIQGRITPTKDNWWWVGFPNLAYNAGDITTALGYMATHLPELGKKFVKYEKQNHQDMMREAKMAKQMLKDGTMTPFQYIDYIGRAMYSSPLVQTGKDILNAVGTPYAIKNTTPAEFIEATKQGGLKGLKNKAVEQAKETAKSILESPLDVILDATGAGISTKIAKNIPTVNKAIKAGETAEKTINVKTAKVAQDINKINETLDSAKKVAKDNNVDMGDLVRRAEETGDWTGIPDNVRKSFKDFSDKYNEIAKKHSPQTAVDPEHLTIAQNIARKRNITYRDAEKNIKALYESIPEGTDRNIGLKNLASDGDKLAQEVVSAKQAYREGRLFPVTHAMDDGWIIDDLEKNMRGLDDIDRVYSGKFSTREYGLHKYEDIGKALATPNDFLEALSKQYLGNNIKQELKQGTLNGSPIAAEKATDNVYISQKALDESGSIEKLEKAATPQPTSVTDIAIDKRVLKELSNQTKKVGEYFKSDLLNDAIKLGKGSMLAGMTYLGANAIGGGINAVMASGLHTLNDLANAIKTQGKLTREMGIYRKTREIKPLKTKLLNPIQQVNKYTTGAVTDYIDRKIQNVLAEMGAHRNLREMGINPKSRIKAVEDMDAERLADIIGNIKSEALLESTRTTLPRWMIEVGSMANPFWRWTDTAARSTIHMTKKYPIMSNILLNQTLARIGFDEEMQNRANLGVRSDKRGVTFYFDEKTGQIKQASVEWIPQQNTFKLISDPVGYFKENPLASPTLTKMINAFQGKDQYGRPLKRADREGRITHIPDNLRGVRYVMTPYGWVEQGGRLDEVLATFAKEQIGVFNAMNKTLLPSAATLTGNKFYQPYAQSLFGSINNDDTTTNFLSGGNPRQPRGLGDVMMSFGGIYSQPYIPRLQEEHPLSARQGRTLMRNMRYDLLRKQRGY